MKLSQEFHHFDKNTNFPYDEANSSYFPLLAKTAGSRHQGDTRHDQKHKQPADSG